MSAIVVVECWMYHQRNKVKLFFLCHIYPGCVRAIKIWTESCKNVSYGICGQRRPRSAQSDQGLHCPLTESLNTTKCMNGKQRPGWYFAHAQDDLNLRILRMFEGTFSLDAAPVSASIIIYSLDTFICRTCKFLTLCKYNRDCSSDCCKVRATPSVKISQLSNWPTRILQFGRNYPANRKRYHNVFIWFYESLVATQRCVNVTMMFAIRSGKVMLKPNTSKRYLNVR